MAYHGTHLGLVGVLDRRPAHAWKVDDVNHIAKLEEHRGPSETTVRLGVLNLSFSYHKRTTVSLYFLLLLFPTNLKKKGKGDEECLSNLPGQSGSLHGSR